MLSDLRRRGCSTPQKPPDSTAESFLSHPPFSNYFTSIVVPNPPLPSPWPFFGTFAVLPSLPPPLLEHAFHLPLAFPLLFFLIFSDSMFFPVKGFSSLSLLLTCLSSFLPGCRRYLNSFLLCQPSYPLKPFFFRVFASVCSPLPGTPFFPLQMPFFNPHPYYSFDS